MKIKCCECGKYFEDKIIYLEVWNHGMSIELNFRCKECLKQLKENKE